MICVKALICEGADICSHHCKCSNRSVFSWLQRLSKSNVLILVYIIFPGFKAPLWDSVGLNLGVMLCYLFERTKAPFHFFPLTVKIDYLVTDCLTVRKKLCELSIHLIFFIYWINAATAASSASVALLFAAFQAGTSVPQEIHCELIKTQWCNLF